jgi:hypothetical protein
VFRRTKQTKALGAAGEHEFFCRALNKYLLLVPLYLRGSYAFTIPKPEALLAEGDVDLRIKKPSFVLIGERDGFLGLKADRLSVPASNTRQELIVLKVNSNIRCYQML